MKALWILFAAAAPIPAQDQPIQLRPPDLNFRDFKLPGRPNPFVMTNPVMVNPVKTNPILRLELLEKPPQKCAIPLLQVVPKGNYPMKMVKPAQPVPSMPDVTVPAPACKDWNR